MERNHSVNIRRFIQSRVDRPKSGEARIWCESVYAALFTVMFETITRSHSVLKVSEALVEETRALVESGCPPVADWMGPLVERTPGGSKHGSVPQDVLPEMRTRVLQYFHEAYNAVAHKAYEPPFARSHACFIILRRVLAQLGRSSGLALPEATLVLEKVMEDCERIAREFRNSLQDEA